MMQPDDQLRLRNEDEYSKNCCSLNLSLAANGSLENIFKIFTTDPRIDEAYTTDTIGPKQEALIMWIYRAVEGKGMTGRQIILGAGIAFEGKEDLNCERK